MERRTSKFAVVSILSLLSLALPLPSWVGPAHAAGVVDPDGLYPVSRFGVSETQVSSGRGPASVDEEEMRGRDEITNRSASPVGAGAGSGGKSMPLGTLRRNGVQEVALIAGDLGFFPRTVFVTRDIPVRMYVTGASKNSLCILMDSFQVRKQVKSQKIEEVSFTPTQPGKFRFYCPINGAEGYMVVREFERADSN